MRRAGRGAKHSRLAARDVVGELAARDVVRELEPSDPVAGRIKSKELGRGGRLGRGGESLGACRERFVGHAGHEAWCDREGVEEQKSRNMTEPNYRPRVYAAPKTQTTRPSATPLNTTPTELQTKMGLPL